jgi:hypothetical protein
LAWRQEGRADQALLLCERGLSIRREALGDRHPGVATALGNLARVWEQAHGEFGKARALRMEALGILEAALGPEHPQVWPLPSPPLPPGASSIHPRAVDFVDFCRFSLMVSLPLLLRARRARRWRSPSTTSRSSSRASATTMPLTPSASAPSPSTSAPLARCFCAPRPCTPTPPLRVPLGADARARGK